jgi:hypothetical protein
VKRGLAVLALCLLASAACASDPSTVERSSGSTTTTVVGSPPVVDRPTPPKGSGVPPTSAVGARPAPTTTAAPGAAQPGDPGADAPRYLRADRSRSIRVQILVEPGAEPRQSTIDRLRSQLSSVSGKSVSVSGGSLPATGGRRWTASAIAETAAGRVPRLDDDVALLQILFVAGSYDDDDGILGIAVNARVAAVFNDRVSAAATGLVGPDRLELAVATHEVGHLLGLVDLYLRTGRADPEHPGHSSNPRSVMYWAVESDVVSDLITGGPPVDFDAADRADLAAIRRG